MMEKKKHTHTHTANPKEVISTSLGSDIDERDGNRVREMPCYREREKKKRVRDGERARGSYNRMLLETWAEISSVKIQLFIAERNLTAAVEIVLFFFFHFHIERVDRSEGSCLRK